MHFCILCGPGRLDYMPRAESVCVNAHIKNLARRTTVAVAFGAPDAANRVAHISHTRREKEGERARGDVANAYLCRLYDRCGTLSDPDTFDDQSPDTAAAPPATAPVYNKYLPINYCQRIIYVVFRLHVFAGVRTLPKEEQEKKHIMCVNDLAIRLYFRTVFCVWLCARAFAKM